jgi:hypothetical protein
LSYYLPVEISTAEVEFTGFEIAGVIVQVIFYGDADSAVNLVCQTYDSFAGWYCPGSGYSDFFSTGKTLA